MPLQVTYTTMVPRERMPSSEVSVPVGRAEAERLAKAHGVSVAAANAPELHVCRESMDIVK